MSEFSLHKTEKLCSRTAVNRLFAEGKPAKAYPLRAVYNESNRTYGAAAQFMITIPKKKIRKAVGRVLADTSVGCPPAVPIAVSGEIIDENAVRCFEYYGIGSCIVTKEIDG